MNKWLNSSEVFSALPGVNSVRYFAGCFSNTFPYNLSLGLSVYINIGITMVK